MGVPFQTDIDAVFVQTTLPSAATVDLSTVGTRGVYITATSGSLSISSFGTRKKKKFLVQFAAGITLVHGSALVCPGAANIVTKANDTCLVVSDASGNYTVQSYVRAAQRGMIDGTFSGPLSIDTRLSWNIVASDPNPITNLTTSEPTGFAMPDIKNSDGTTAVASKDRFYLPNARAHTSNGGIGHRGMDSDEYHCYGATTGKFVVGRTIIVQMHTGSGNCFPLNLVGIINGAASNEIEFAGLEINPVIERDIVRKVGMQIYDGATSGGRGTVVDVGYLLGKQIGGFGFAQGLQFGAQGDANQFPVRNALIYADVGTCASGIDLRSPTLSTNQAILLAAGHKISFATGGGGTITSLTGSGGQILAFADGNTLLQNNDGSGFIVFDKTNASVYPSVDTGVSLGRSNNKFNTVFASTGQIQTSDETTKNNLGAPDDKLLDATGDIEIVIFQYLSSIAEKGEDKARIHSGVIAQQLAQALRSHGLDPWRYSFWCQDPLLEDHEVVEVVEKPVLIDETYEDQEFVLEDDGCMVARMVEKTRQVPKIQNHPVFMPDGTPHITPAKPAKVRENKDGSVTVISAAVPEHHTMIGRAVTEPVEVRRIEQRQKLDADGKPMTLLGVRYGDLSMLLHAWARRQLARTEQRLAVLEKSKRA